MGQRMNSAIGKVLYGALFALVLPMLLVFWAIATEGLVAAPALRSLPYGLVLVVLGFSFLSLGMANLWKLGGGLPMNAFPPPRYVSGGIYRLFCHPIYVGFSIVCVGSSILAGSASGLWLVTPAVILASAALVWGYELPDMRKRFGDALPDERFFPADQESAPSGLERLRCYLTVLLPWLVFYEAFVALGMPRNSKVAYMPFEQRLPVLPWTEIFYGSVYVVVVLGPLAARTRRQLRTFSIQAVVSMAIVFPMFFAFPLIAPPRPFSGDGWTGELLNWERSLDTPAAAFPSYHVIWAFIAADLMAGQKAFRKIAGCGWATLVSVSCVTTGMHALVDVIAGFLIYLFVARIWQVWSWVRRSAEGIANSWREWRIGPLRIINHGAYAGAGAVIGIWIIDTLLGPAKSAVSIAIFVGGIVGAVFWAQWIEGSPALLRPLGFYGGMLGSSAAAVAGMALGVNPWLALCALCVAAPWIQGVGRLRCLVQGCCHGRATSSLLGISYVHPRSRVSRIASLRGTPVHATPLYSILWNGVIALVVTRLCLLRATTTMVCGVYLILSGLGRFAEEAYRGEPQTPVYRGLRLYQWIAIATILFGAVITTFVKVPLAPQPLFHSSSVPLAFACGLLTWFVTGVDFPESNRRFARLT
jgi:protein-S-isoprenylcysteine O-methyltransferase Ste14